MGLTWAHIFCEVLAMNDAVEAIEPVSDGNGPSRFVAVVTGPAAETGNGPTGPGHTVGRMRVLLLGRAPLQFLLHRMQDFDLPGVEHAAGRRVLARGRARQPELPRGRGGGPPGRRGHFAALPGFSHTLVQSARPA